MDKSLQQQQQSNDLVARKPFRFRVTTFEKQQPKLGKGGYQQQSNSLLMQANPHKVLKGSPYKRIDEDEFKGDSIKVTRPAIERRDFSQYLPQPYKEQAIKYYR